MRRGSIIASVLIIISLIYRDMPDWVVVGTPSVITATVLFMETRYLHLLTLSIPFIIAPAAVIVDPDNALVALWLRIGGVLACLVSSAILYNTIDKDCTIDFKKTCFKGVLADLSLLGIIPAALDIYFGWMSIGSGISLFLTLAYGFYLIYEPKNPTASNNLMDNGEQEMLFGSINDDDI